MVKNFITILLSFFITILLLYIFYFIKISSEKHYENPNLFKSSKTMEFYKKYSDQLHHLRDTDGRWYIKDVPENYLFTIVNNFNPYLSNENNNRNVLLQGDSWIEQMIDSQQSFELSKKISREKKIGLINGGITSFSPTLMKLQFVILERDFNIKPDVVIAYIDQTDIGDELCRYKYNKIIDKNKNLQSVKKEEYTKATYDYTRIFNISEINFKNTSKFKKNINLTNFFIKYGFLRFKKRIESISKFGLNPNIAKCRFKDIKKYLVRSNEEDIDYFKVILNDYINFLNSKKYIKNIILVTFPHKHNIIKNEKSIYSINVSNIVDEVILKLNEKKIVHLNFSQMLLNKNSKNTEIINFNESWYKIDDPGSHLNSYYHAKFFTQKITDFIK